MTIKIEAAVRLQAATMYSAQKANAFIKKYAKEDIAFEAQLPGAFEAHPKSLALLEEIIARITANYGKPVRPGTWENIARGTNLVITGKNKGYPTGRIIFVGPSDAMPKKRNSESELREDRGGSGGYRY